MENGLIKLFMLIIEYSLFTLQIMDGIRLEPLYPLYCFPRRYYANRIHLGDVTLFYFLSFIIIIILMYVKQ